MSCRRAISATPNLVGTVDGPSLGRLGERQHRGADVVRPAPLAALEGSLEDIGRNATIVARQTDQLEAAAEKFRGAAFAGHDVGLAMTQHRPPRRRQLGDRERVRSGSGRHHQGRNVAFEQIAEQAFDPARQRVVAVAEGEPVVGLPDGIEDRRGDTGRIVACEIHIQPIRDIGARLKTLLHCGTLSYSRYWSVRELRSADRRTCMFHGHRSPGVE